MPNGARLGRDIRSINAQYELPAPNAVFKLVPVKPSTNQFKKTFQKIAAKINATPAAIENFRLPNILDFLH